MMEVTQMKKMLEIRELEDQIDKNMAAGFGK